MELVSTMMQQPRLGKLSGLHSSIGDLFALMDHNVGNVISGEIGTHICANQIHETKLSHSLTAQQAVRDKVMEYCHAMAAPRPRDCRATAVDQSESGSRQSYGELSRNAHVTVAQRPRDCRTTAVDQSASGARQGYWVLSRNGRATLKWLSRNGRRPISNRCATSLWRTFAQRPRNAPRDCRATPHVTVAQRPSTNQQYVRDKVMEDYRATSAQRPTWLPSNVHVTVA